MKKITNIAILMLLLSVGISQADRSFILSSSDKIKQYIEWNQESSSYDILENTILHCTGQDVSFPNEMVHYVEDVLFKNGIMTVSNIGPWEETITYHTSDGITWYKGKHFAMFNPDNGKLVATTMKNAESNWISGQIQVTCRDKSWKRNNWN